VGKLAGHGEIGGGHTGSRGDNVTSASDRGNSATYTLRRLKRDRPELAARVVVWLAFLFPVCNSAGATTGPMRTFTLAVSLAVAASHPAAADRFLGIGTASCGLWTEVRHSPDNPAIAPAEQWVIGFISGAGYGNPDISFDSFYGLNIFGVWSWVDSYCAAHPSSRMFNATQAFIHEHSQ
jgi:hypothetical protein